MFCAQCGTPADAGARFCSSCGARLGGAEQEAEPEEVVTKTFTSMQVFPDTQGMVREINAWFSANRDFRFVRVHLQISNSVVRQVTLEATRASRPMPYTLEMSTIECIAKPRGQGFFGMYASVTRQLRANVPASVFLDEWHAAHPGRKVVYRRIVNSGAVAAEIWILAKKS